MMRLAFRHDRLPARACFLAVCVVLAIADRTSGQVTLDPIPVPAFGGTVNAVERVGNLLFIGGSFLGGSPPSDARGGLSIHDGQTAARALDTVYVSGDVFAVVSDGSGGYYVGGNFRMVATQARLHVARIRADGSLDPSFAPVVSEALFTGSVRALTRAGNTLFLGGNFDAVNGQLRSNLAAVDATTGTLLPFNAVLTGTVATLAVSGANVYVGGNFDQVDGQPRTGLAAFAIATGGLLPWTPSFSGQVRDVEIVGSAMFVAGASIRKFDLNSGAALPLMAPSFPAGQLFDVEVIDDTTIAVGGAFTTVVSGAQMHTRVHLAVFDPVSGAISPWAPNPSEPIDAMEVADGTLYIGGRFANVSGEVRGGAAAFDWTDDSGTLLPWDPSMNGGVHVLLEDAGLVVMGGEFTAPNAVVRRAVAQLDLTTHQLTSWQAENVLGEVEALAVSGNRVLVGGATVAILSGVTPIDRFFVPLDAASGVQVTPWDLPDGPVSIIEATADAIYIAGSFTMVGTQSRAGIAAFTLGGTVNAFSPAVPVGFAMKADASYLYIGGAFIVGGMPQGIQVVDRFSGSVAPVNVPVFGSVWDMAIDQQTLYIGGSFSTVAGVARQNLAAIDLTTRMPTDWNPGATYVYPTQTLALGGGRVFAAGTSLIGGVPLDTFAVISTNGSVLGTAAFDGPVLDLDVPDARVILAGSFDFTTSTPSPGLAMFTVGTTTLPGAPQNLQVSVVGNSVTLTWSPPIGGAVSGYVLEAGIAPGAPLLTIPVGNVTSFNVIAPNGVYYVRVRALGAAGAGPPSNEVQVTVPSCAVPPAPGTLTGNVVGSFVSLSWQPSTAAGVTYVLEAGTSTGSSDVGVLPMGATTSFSAVAPPGIYFVRVRAVSSCGVSPPTNEVVLAVAGAMVPSAPTNLQANVSASMVTLSWSAPATGAPILNYVVEVGSTPVTPTNLLVASLGAGLSLTASAPAGTYFVRIRAQNATGIGPPSQQIVVVVP